MQRFLLNVLYFFLLFVTPIIGRQHALQFRNDSRINILCSTFSFDGGATLTVELSNFPINSLGNVGFTFDRTSNAGIRSMVTSKPDTCFLSEGVALNNIPGVLLVKLGKKSGLLSRPIPKGITLFSSNTEQLYNMKQVDDDLHSLIEPLSIFLQEFTTFSPIYAQESAEKILELIRSDESILRSTKSIISGAGDPRTKIRNILASIIPSGAVRRHRRDVSLRKDSSNPISESDEEDIQKGSSISRNTNEEMSEQKSESHSKLSPTQPRMSESVAAHSVISENEDPDTKKGRRIVNEGQILTPLSSNGKMKVNEIVESNSGDDHSLPENLMRNQSLSVASDNSQNQETGPKKKKNNRRGNLESGTDSLNQRITQGEHDMPASKGEKLLSVDAGHDKVSQHNLSDFANQDDKSTKRTKEKRRMSKTTIPTSSDLEKTEQKLEDNKLMEVKLPNLDAKRSLISLEDSENKEREETIVDGSDKIELDSSNPKLKEEAAGVRNNGDYSDDEDEELLGQPLIDENRNLPQKQIHPELLSTIKEAVSNSPTKHDTFLPYVIKKGKVSINFTVAFYASEALGTYDLFFHNCLNKPVDAVLRIIEKNMNSFLSTGEQPLPVLYATFCLIYLLLSLMWLIYMRLSKAPVFRIHHMMLALIFIKSISLAFHSINFYAIGKHGVPEEGWVIMYYIANVIRGFLFFLTVLLIGTGWTFFKHVFTRREKNLFLVVLPLQILANVATIVIEESELGTIRFITWNEIFTVVDLICCAAILFPVIWSIRHLQRASQSDGKAAQNLRKLRLFRHFYIMTIFYIYFTRIVVYLLKISIPYNLSWLTELFEQVVTLVFLTSVGYKFRPFNDNPYLQLPTDDEEDTLMERFEMEEAWTQSGITDGVTRLHKPQHMQSALASRRERDVESSKHLLSPDDPLNDEDSDRYPLVRP